jgi:hypothetical protein
MSEVPLQGAVERLTYGSCMGEGSRVRVTPVKRVDSVNPKPTLGRWHSQDKHCR